MTNQRGVTVVHYQRKRRANSNFSLEFIFADVRNRLGDSSNINYAEAPCLSNGFFRRIWIAVHAWWKQGTVTHVTGDITFAALLLNRRQTVLTILDCGILKRKRGFRRWLIKKLWFDWPMRRARYVTTISQSAADELKHECSFDHSKLIVIPVAISDKFVHSPKDSLSSPPRLLQVGTAPNKNLPRLLTAIEGLDVEIVIIGKLTDEHLSLLESKNIRYRNLYNLSEEEMVEQYRLADIVCFTSLYEGFGMPILEAQATGRPVVTSNRCSMPEVAGDAAVFVDPESVPAIRVGIQKLVCSSELRNDLISKGLVNIRRFSPSQIAQRFASLYMEIITNASRR
jgi:glycosyltransferase involved in cell wall biosynthesis